MENTKEKAGFLTDRVITRIGDYEIEAERITYNGFIQHISLKPGNGQSRIDIHTAVGIEQKSNEALELLNEFWASLESRGKDFDYGKEIPGLEDLEKDVAEPLDESRTAELWAKAEPRYIVHVTTSQPLLHCKKPHFKLFHSQMRDTDTISLVVLAPGNTIKDLRNSYTQSAIDQTFSKAEVKLIHDYFKKTFGDIRFQVIVAKNAPSNNCMGYGAECAGGGWEFETFYELPGYSLPFKIEGLVDLYKELR